MLVNNKQFVQAWLKNGGRESVGKRCGMNVQQESAKALYLRKRGVNLPKLDRHYNEDYSVAYLNSLIERGK